MPLMPLLCPMPGDKAGMCVVPDGDGGTEPDVDSGVIGPPLGERARFGVGNVGVGGIVTRNVDADAEDGDGDGCTSVRDLGGTLKVLSGDSRGASFIGMSFAIAGSSTIADAGGGGGIMLVLATLGIGVGSAFGPSISSGELTIIDTTVGGGDGILALDELIFTGAGKGVAGRFFSRFFNRRCDSETIDLLRCGCEDFGLNHWSWTTSVCVAASR